MQYMRVWYPIVMVIFDGRETDIRESFEVISLVPLGLECLIE